MAKKSHQGLAVLLILAALGFLIYSNNNILQTIQCTGFNSLGLGQVDFVSNDPIVGGKAWLLTVSQNCQGQSAVGRFTKDQVKDTADNTNSLYDFEISTTVDKQTCQYPITNQMNKIYAVQSTNKDVTFGWDVDAEKKACVDSGGSWFVAYNLLPIHTSCIQKAQQAEYGLIGTKTTVFESTVSMKKGAETISGKIGNAGPGSVWLGDKAYVSWSGNLVSGEECPNPGDYGVSAVYRNGAWSITDKQKFVDYGTQDSTTLPFCLEQVKTYSGDKGWTINKCVSDYNNAAIAAMVSKSFTSSGGSTATANGTSSNGQVTINLNKLVQFPVLTFKVKADWLGINQPVGQPKITSVSSNEFQTGNTGFIVAQIQNIGAGSGSFSITASCPSPFSVQGAANYITLAPGDTGTVNIPISGQTGAKVSQACTVRAEDRNNPNNFDTKTVTVSMAPIIMCTAGQLRCEGTAVMECSSSGSGWAAKQQCVAPQTCVPSLTGAACGGGTPTPTPTSKPGPVCLKDGEIKGVVQNTLGQKCCEGLVEEKGTDVLGLEKICREPPTPLSWLDQLLKGDLVTLALYGTAGLLVLAIGYSFINRRKR